jgi:hypothetical protein
VRELTAHALAELQALADELTVSNGREHGQDWALKLAAEMGGATPFIVEIEGRPCTELVPVPAAPAPATYKPAHRQATLL